MAKAKLVNASAGLYGGFAPINKAEAPWINGSFRFHWPEGRCENEVTKDGHQTLYKGTRPAQVILRFLVGQVFLADLGRTWPGSLSWESRFETEVTAKPLAKAKGHMWANGNIIGGEMCRWTHDRRRIKS